MLSFSRSCIEGVCTFSILSLGEREITDPAAARKEG